MLKVNEMFQSIQTEGPFAGRPATFVRLSGCNLSCDFCDTDHSKFTEMSDEEVFDAIAKMEYSTHLVIITGGEPFLQDFSILADVLIEQGYIVQVETNGSVIPPPSFCDSLLKDLEIVCSPKTGVNIAMWPHINAVKYLVDRNTSHISLQDIFAKKKQYRFQLYFQPIMEDDAANTKLNIQHAVELCKFYNKKLSLQYHKLIDIP